MNEKKEVQEELDQLTHDSILNKDKNKHARTLGSLGGLKGGRARANKLSKERRAEIAKKAAETRWANKK